jgi:2-(acetamidomethylene)succinate hydrolase
MAAPFAYRDRWVDVPDGQLHVVEWATRGPVVLLTHGITAQAHVWDPIAARLSASYHVLSLDQRGHGDSLKPATGYALDDYLADMLAVLDAFDAERAVVGGHSLGGRNAFAFAARHPARAALMVAVEYGPWIERRSFALLNERVLNAPERFPSRQTALDYLASRYPRLTPAALARRADYGLLPEGSALVWKYSRSAIEQTLALLDVDLGPLVDRARSPALIVRGSDSNFYNAAAYEHLRQLRPELEYAEFPAATHYVPEERPDDLADLLLSFFQRNSPALPSG